MLKHFRLLETLKYCDGVFIRLITRGNAKKGSVAGTIDSKGHRQVCIDGKKYLAHRLVWFYHNGEWPDGDIDHINGIRDDNRIENLRKCSRQQNMFNRKSTTNSTSRYKGVSWKSKNNKWVAQACVSGKVKHLGLFNTELEAKSAYDNYVKDIHGDYKHDN